MILPLLLLLLLLGVVDVDGLLDVEDGLSIRFDGGIRGVWYLIGGWRRVG